MKYYIIAIKGDTTYYRSYFLRRHEDIYSYWSIKFKKAIEFISRDEATKFTKTHSYKYTVGVPSMSDLKIVSETELVAYLL
jgi:hypothetical protein